MKPGDLCKVDKWADLYLMKGHHWGSGDAGYMDPDDVVLIITILDAPKAVGRRQCLVVAGTKVGWTYEDRLRAEVP